jgi:glycosyltransferase involved in cell wall biosynthesis
VTIAAIIPTWNRNDLLFSRALVSVLRQTHPVDEIIVVADGMDGPELDDLGARALAFNDPRLVVYNIDRPDYPTWPGGLWLVKGYAARNFGLDRARSHWVAPLDDDDEWTDDHIEVLLGAVIEKGVDFAYGKAQTPLGQWYGHWPPSGANFADGAQLYRRDMGYRYDIGCIERGKAADQDLWDRMVEGGVTFTFVDHLVHRYFRSDQ